MLEKGHFIPQTDMCAYREVFGKVGIYSCDGELITFLSGDYTDREIDLWGLGYKSGFQEGMKYGEICGTYKTQQTLRAALGIRN